MSIDSQKLFNYAEKFTRRHELAGSGSVYPTVRQAARRFKCTQQAIEDATYDGVDFGYLGIVAGFRAGGGHATYEDGDRQVEAYR
ncbi:MULTISPECIES: hypothetical protein [unclassified Polaromonas]|jgi:hypothetical protein|uniref:hypothetical protein n=1 Tax=unclassified Polaromonas TaxID=2638319 RepID=UPI000BC92C6B|nr:MULTISPECIES: hypothetical protein [unclassified Polaromonas]OYY34799.1 MAG: hypothetical protein B7Y60_15280 [Polaromonas sp. 35-63-35]OYZ19315.1 MAG: hypothetical protein B7Y28_12315 [Polaromonas sp. 16-63-31]OYZ77560.1 MAG: hypothetical protein B7Y09_16440 [Polaromonas sp. 24-63-21]OZA48457.1 MAG: hypothetical protein B7X88_18080 [Polaromonas sp. 17-63-33]OZA87205.1 MAG: hypothetical protein B7X65_13550 [Polaromonas sp. 39-63-25]